MHEVRLFVIGDDDQRVPFALRQPGQAEPALCVGLGLQDHDPDEIRPGEPVAADLDVRERLAGLGVLHDAFDRPARRRGVGEVGPVDRLVPRAVACWETRGRDRLHLPGGDVDRRDKRSARPGVQPDDPLGSEALEPEPAVLVGRRLARRCFGNLAVVIDVLAAIHGGSPFLTPSSQGVRSSDFGISTEPTLTETPATGCPSRSTIRPVIGTSAAAAFCGLRCPGRACRCSHRTCRSREPARARASGPWPARTA